MAKARSTLFTVNFLAMDGGYCQSDPKVFIIHTMKIKIKTLKMVDEALPAKDYMTLVY